MGREWGKRDGGRVEAEGKDVSRAVPCGGGEDVLEEEGPVEADDKL